MPKLTANQVTSIRIKLSAGDKQADIAAIYGVSRSTISDIATGRIWRESPQPGKQPAKAAKAVEVTPLALLSLLRRGRLSTSAIAEKTGGKAPQIERLIRSMQETGALIFRFGEEWGIDKSPPASADKHVYKARKDGTYLFGFCGDSHLCSKYERLDVLNDLYDRFEAAGVDRVMHAGNWIDGEARFNMHDLKVHGLDQQMKYLADNYPQRDGIVTYAVAGDDHEGWYGQRDGIDIGKHAARIMKESGRDDWQHLGYMESFVALRHPSDSESQMLVMHPGGGSAYAYSYRPQKIVESFSGGEKPAVLLMGHYHKISHNVIRNVWAIQCGCTQDQTPFMRKKSIDAHVGGGICKLTQDERGAVTACQVEFFLYYNAGYYNDRWSHGGSVTLPKRGSILRASEKKKELTRG